jgi:hypothetical protein
MMTPDSETHVRVWKFRIERNFFSDATTWCTQRVIVARQQQDFVCLLARDRGASAMFKLNFSKVEFGITERSPTE